VNPKHYSQLSHLVKLLERQLARRTDSRNNWKKCAELQGGDIKRLLAERDRLKGLLDEVTCKLNGIIKRYEAIISTRSTKCQGK